MPWHTHTLKVILTLVLIFAGFGGLIWLSWRAEKRDRQRELDSDREQDPPRDEPDTELLAA